METFSYVFVYLQIIHQPVNKSSSFFVLRFVITGNFCIGLIFGIYNFFAGLTTSNFSTESLIIGVCKLIINFSTDFACLFSTFFEL